MKLIRPGSVAEAASALAGDGRAVAYAGGIEVLLALRGGTLRADTLVDVKRIPGASGVRRDGAVIRIGPATAHHVISGDPVVLRDLPLLARACGSVGTTRVRMQGTLGGNLANGHPHTDPGAAALVHGGTVCVASATARREIELAEFWRGPGVVARRDDEIVESICLRPLPADWFVAHERVEVRHRPPTAIVSFAARAVGGVIVECRIAVGAAASRPVRLTEMERALAGVPVARSAAVIAGGCRLIADDVDAETDGLGGREFKLRLVLGLIQRAASGLEERL